MRITQLEAENVLRLQAVSLDFDGNVFVIGGENGAGKSSCLEALKYALAGASSFAEKPVREGADKATIRVKLEDEKGGGYLVLRDIRVDGKTSLEVRLESEPGVTAKVSKPQQLLESLYGSLAFDPLEFVRQQPGKQVETLKKLVNVDTTAIDADIEVLSEERGDANREVKRLEGVVQSAKRHDDAPESEVSAAEVLSELKAANAVNDERDEAATERDEACNEMYRKERIVRECKAELDRMKQAADAKAEDLKRLSAEHGEAENEFNRLNDVMNGKRIIDTDPIEAKLHGLEEVNRKVRDNRAADQSKAELDKAREFADELTTRIEEKRQAKLGLMQSAKWPVEGLGFGANGVTFNGLPFDQCSSAEQLKIATAIGFGQNPRLRLVCIRDGSLLDKASMKAMHEIADQYEGQIVIERVSTGKECSVVICDGRVAGSPQPESEAPTEKPATRTTKRKEPAAAGA